jgi:hypothetical protein
MEPICFIAGWNLVVRNVLRTRGNPAFLRFCYPPQVVPIRDLEESADMARLAGWAMIFDRK